MARQDAWGIPGSGAESTKRTSSGRGASAATRPGSAARPAAVDRHRVALASTACSVERRIVLEPDSGPELEGPHRVVVRAPCLPRQAGYLALGIEWRGDPCGQRLVHLPRRDLLGSGRSLQRIRARDTVGHGPDERAALARRAAGRDRGRRPRRSTLRSPPSEERARARRRQRLGEASTARLSL